MSPSFFFNRPSSTKDIPLLPIYESRNPTPYQTAPGSPTPQPTPAAMTSNTTQIPQSDALLNLSRQEVHLQSTLQTLLDAQSEGLLAGLAGGPPQEEASSTGSRTPTTESVLHYQGPKSVVPVRQPAKRKLGLRSARRGIERTIADLASLKGEESRVLEDEVAQREGILSTVRGFERKLTGLRAQIRGIESEDSSCRVEHLKREEKTLGNDILEMETKLYGMKARHRHLQREIDGLSNRVQSKLSSYESALSLAERDIQEFLTRPPIEAPTGVTGWWSLPRERRTLEMANEHYKEEQQTLRDRFRAVQAETTALEEGGTVWEDVVQDITTVEISLREEMQRMQAPLLETADARTAPATNGIKKLLQTMQTARIRIESQLDLAETNSWKLLECCIGAELEALIEGQTVLEGALEASLGSGPKDQSGGAKQKQSNGTDLGKEPQLGGLVGGSGPQGEAAAAQGFLDRSEDEDDGPMPDLLISHHDED